MLSLPNSGPEMQNDHLWLEKKKWSKEEASLGTREIFKNRRTLYRRYVLHQKPHAIRVLKLTIKKKKKGWESLT